MTRERIHPPIMEKLGRAMRLLTVGLIGSDSPQWIAQIREESRLSELPLKRAANWLDWMARHGQFPEAGPGRHGYATVRITAVEQVEHIESGVVVVIVDLDNNEPACAVLQDLPSTVDAVICIDGQVVIDRGPKNVVLSGRAMANLYGEGARVLALDLSIAHLHTQVKCFAYDASVVAVTRDAANAPSKETIELYEDSEAVVQEDITEADGTVFIDAYDASTIRMHGHPDAVTVGLYDKGKVWSQVS